MITMKFYLKSNSKEDCKRTLQRVFKEKSQLVESFTIVSTEKKEKEGVIHYIACCEVVPINKYLGYDVVNNLLMTLANNWEWSFSSVHSSQRNMNAEIVKEEVTFIDCYPDSESELIVSLIISTNSQEKALDTASKLIHVNKNVTSYKITGCAESLKTEGCYEIVGNVQFNSALFFEEYINILKSWSTKWGFSGLRADSKVSSNNLMIDPSILEISCSFRKGIDIH